MELKDFKAGDRIEMHPASDRWMRGDRFAEVQRVGRKLLLVKFDRSKDVVNVHPRNVGEVVS